ncbi:MAG: CehA/McbA family metallohydrolase [Nanoarchaeota archaeon]|nr:CehA/McbA family metallohydrolase [Nanoarchaeota archaeon]
MIISTNWSEKYVISSGNIPYFYLFKIDKSKFLKNENNQVSVKIKFDLWLYTNEEGSINITISDKDIPRINNWFYGDTHVHSNYTDNPYEYGAPVYATSEAANAIGLNWVTITDHSFDQTNLSTNWNDYLRECNADKRCLPAEEVSCDWGAFGYYSHYLYYNASIFMDGAEVYWGDTKTCLENINRINTVGFGYVAHPEHNDRLRVEWKNYSLPFTGLEVWNSIGESWEKERDQAMQKWVEQILLGRKIFIEAGSDAHGDFNSALGKVRTACFASNFTKDNIFTALKSGNCMMTDGPIVIFTANSHIIGESFNVSEGDTILLNISWNSTNEFGNVTEIVLIRGEINGSEINETILSPNNLSGNFILTSTPNNTYYRIEARSIDSEGIVRRAYTNPIWAYAEPVPEVEKIPMDEAELALVARFENKYDYSLKNLFFDGEPTATCDITSLRENLNLNNLWQSVKCEKMILDNKRLMWAGFNNTETNKKQIILQIDNILQYTNATQNTLQDSWKSKYAGTGSTRGNYINTNWIAEKNGTIFEINEITNSNDCSGWGGCPRYFGTYLIHGFRKYGENTTVYYSYWGPDRISFRDIHDVYLKFDNKIIYPITNGYILNTKGIFQKKTYNYNPSSFGFGADGGYGFSDSTGCSGFASGSGFDPINRSVFPISQTESVIICHADIDCNDGDLLTKDICANAGTPESLCEYAPQEPEEIKKPFTEMDADEVEKAIIFKEKYNKSLSELYFDGWTNTSCNNASILDTLKLDKDWSVIQCRKFLINGTLAMFAGLNNTKTGEKYAAYQLGTVLIDELAENKQVTETYRTGFDAIFLTHYENRWSGIKEGIKRFEISDVATRTCDGFGRCGSIYKYGTYIFHGFRSDENKNESVLYSYSKPITADTFKILFDNYRNFSIDNFSSSGNIYETKTFNYLPLHGWALGTFGFNYSLYNRSIFKPYRANELIVGLESPAHLRAQDSIGRITGYVNGAYVTEIPNSEILDTEHEKYLLPANETYRFFVDGYADGNYSLKITRAIGENSSIIYFKNISATNETRDIFELNETASIGVKTNDSEKNIVVALDSLESSESINFTAAKNKSVSIYVSNWSALNESTTITENINYAPEIISTVPENGSSFGQWRTISLGVYATDPNNDTLQYVILFDETEISPANETTYTLNETGTHTITFSASDGLNTVSEEISIYVIAPPKVTIISPENRTYNTNIIFINATFEEPVDKAWISINGAPGQNYTSNASSISGHAGVLPNGTQNIRVYANNSIGIENYSEVFFSINTTVIIPTNPPSNGGGGHGDGKKEKKTKEKDDKDEKHDDKEDHKEDKKLEYENDKLSKDKDDDKHNASDSLENETRYDDETENYSESENNGSYYTGHLLGNISEKLQRLIMMILGYLGLWPA